MNKKIFLAIFGMIFLFGILSLGSATFDNSLDTGLKAYYQLDESSGAIIDATGNGWSGTNNGATQGTLGKISSAYDFEADESDYAYSNSNIGITGSNDFTINAWFKTERETGADFQNVFSLGTSGTACQIVSFALQYNTANAFSVNTWGCSGVGGENFPSGVTFLNTWHMATMTYDGTNLRIYIDGVNVKNQTGTLSLVDNKFYFGGRYGGFNGGYFDGVLDEEGLWSRALSTDEISLLYNDGDGLPYSGDFTEYQVELLSPINESVITSTGTNFTANFTISYDNTYNYTWQNATYYVWDSERNLFNQTTIILPELNQTNYTLFIDNFEIGNYFWDVYGCYGNSTFSNCSLSDNGDFTFFVGANIISSIYTNETYETATENFVFEVEILEGSEISLAQLVYIGTNYTIQNITSNGEIYTFTKKIDVPLNFNSSDNQTNPFFLRFLYEGSTTQELQIYEQNVSLIKLQLCDVTYTTQALNFSLYDELSETKIDETQYPTTFQADFDFWLGSGNIKKDYSYNIINSTTKSDYQFCILPHNWNQSLKTDMRAVYSAESYSEREYNLENSTLSNISSDIILYLLDSDTYQKFTITVQEGVSVLSNALITIAKYFLGEGEYKTISIRQTDNSGEFIEYLELDEDYRYYVIVDGVLKAVVDKRASCNSAPCEFTLQIDGEQGNVFTSYYQYYANQTISDIAFDENTQIVTYNFLDTSGLAKYFRLLVSQTNINGTDITICDSYSYSSSGTLTCNVTGYTGDFVARGFISRSPERLDKIKNFVISSLITHLDKLLIWLNVVLILTITIGSGLITRGSPSGFLFGFGISILGLKVATIFPFSWAVVGITELIVI